MAESEDGAAILYDLTTNVHGAILEAVLDAPSGLAPSLTLNAGTTHGKSRGPVQLRPGEPAVAVVTDIQPGLENGQYISVEIRGEVTPDMTLQFTLRDPISGARHTVDARL